MVEYDEASHLFAESKLTNLVHQIDVALAEDFPNPDIRSAAEKVRANIAAAIERNRAAAQYSPAIKEQALLGVSNDLANNSQLLGILMRANATRNPFELYYPFRKIARQFFDEGDVFLILSSEWDYVPLTYPSNLEELPNYIIIAMPAPEADNVLAFPAAGHELGHSIWFRRNVREVLSDKALKLTVEFLDGKGGALPTMFPGYVPEQFTSDLIAQGLREQAISDVLEAAMRQLEELFCDFVGMWIFGASYLHAFRYLLAPTTPGSRSSEYPDLCDRAEIISERAEEEGFGSHDLQRWFAREEAIEEEYDAPYKPPLQSSHRRRRKRQWNQSAVAMKVVSSRPHQSPARGSSPIRGSAKIPMSIA